MPQLSDIPARDRRRLWETMLLIRRFEEHIVDIYGQQEMQSPVHLYIGQEAVAAGVCLHLRPEDYLFSTHRSHGHCLAKGADVFSLYAEFYGRAAGCCRGKGGSMHPCAPEVGVLGTTAIVGGGIPLATGAALASKLLGQGRAAVTFFGDGASEEGAFHESLNFAALKALPVVFICENNFYATASPIHQRQPHDDIFRHAAGYGIPAAQVDGNDAVAVYFAAREAVQRARQGGGPSLIEARTYRWKGHVGPSCDWENGCRPKQELEQWMERCPLERFTQRLLQSGDLTDQDIRGTLERTDAMLARELDRAKHSPPPDSSEVWRHVFHETK